MPAVGRSRQVEDISQCCVLPVLMQIFPRQPIFAPGSFPRSPKRRMYNSSTTTSDHNSEALSIVSTEYLAFSSPISPMSVAVASYRRSAWLLRPWGNGPPSPHPRGNASYGSISSRDSGFAVGLVRCGVAPTADQPAPSFLLSRRLPTNLVCKVGASPMRSEMPCDKLSRPANLNKLEGINGPSYPLEGKSLHAETLHPRLSHAEQYGIPAFYGVRG
jgi:hypothetical protein